MSKKLTIELFVSKALNIHGNKYNYDKFIYVNNKNKGIIECYKHGIFLQTPAHHLSGKGCPKCKNEKLKLDRLWNKEEFIKKAIAVHGNKYSYNNFFHRTKEDFEYQIIKDAKKREYAKAWGYKYLEIKYILLEEQSKEVFEKQLMRYIRNMINRSTKGR